MRTALINGREFELYEHIPFTYRETVELYIVNDSSDEIVDTIGDSATVVIPEEYTGTDLVLNYVRRYWDTGVSICETVFKPVPIRDIVNGHTDDIEAISGAIEELAEIISGGDE